MRIGVDIGGTKIEAAALDVRGEVVARRRLATPPGDYAGLVETVRRLVLGLEAELSVAASVGIAMPGALSPATGLVKNSNSTCLIGKPFDRDLEATLGRKLRFGNDANCFAPSRASDSAKQLASLPKRSLRPSVASRSRSKGLPIRQVEFEFLTRPVAGDRAPGMAIPTLAATESSASSPRTSRRTVSTKPA